jgi:hypothetical protein
LGQQRGFFVIRHKENLQFTTVKENELPENRDEHIIKDELIELKNELSKNELSKNKYPKKLRRVAVWVEKMDKLFNLLQTSFIGLPILLGNYIKADGR